jgi:hypothetical protein
MKIYHGDPAYLTNDAMRHDGMNQSLERAVRGASSSGVITVVGVLHLGHLARHMISCGYNVLVMNGGFLSKGDTERWQKDDRSFVRDHCSFFGSENMCSLESIMAKNDSNLYRLTTEEMLHQAYELCAKKQEKSFSCYKPILEVFAQEPGVLARLLKKNSLFNSHLVMSGNNIPYQLTENVNLSASGNSELKEEVKNWELDTKIELHLQQNPSIKPKKRALDFSTKETGSMFHAK